MKNQSNVLKNLGTKLKKINKRKTKLYFNNNFIKSKGCRYTFKCAHVTGVK